MSTIAHLTNSHDTRVVTRTGDIGRETGMGIDGSTNNQGRNGKRDHFKKKKRFREFAGFLRSKNSARAAFLRTQAAANHYFWLPLVYLAKMISSLSILSALLPLALAQDPSASLKDLCAGALAKEPLCELAGACSTTNACQPWSLANAICQLPSASSQTACTAVKAYCSSSSCPAVEAYSSRMPTARGISQSIQSICTEMPGMTDCNTCPDPSPSSGISDCALLATYSRLCMDMPMMSQCATWKGFCDANMNAPPFCSKDTSTSTPKITNAPASNNTNNAQDARKEKSNAIAIQWTTGISLVLLALSL